jgi:hypothetical protein
MNNRNLADNVYRVQSTYHKDIVPGGAILMVRLEKGGEGRVVAANGIRQRGISRCR